MTLDSSVMNVAIATVAKDVGTTVTGIQTAITLYTLVMAMLMIPGGKVGSMIGRKRAFAIGCVIYGAGSLTTALAPNLPVLIVGWSVLEGIGAALILPAIVAWSPSNFAPGGPAARLRPGDGRRCDRGRGRPADRRPGDHVLLLALRVRRRGRGRARRSCCSPGGCRTRRSRARPQFDVVGAVLSATGLGLAVFGVLRSSVVGLGAARSRAARRSSGCRRRSSLIFAGLLRAVAVHPLGAPRRNARPRAAGRLDDVRATASSPAAW